MSAHWLGIKAGAIIIGFVGTLFLCMFYGSLRRGYATRQIKQHVSSNVEIFRLWERENIKGRTLYLFDRHFNATLAEKTVTDENYLDLSLRRGMVRQVYHIVPKSAWQEVRDKLTTNDIFKFSDGVFFMPMTEGRLYVTTLDNIKPDQEIVLTVINRDIWSTDEMGVITGLLDRRILRSDLIAILETQNPRMQP